MGKHYFIEYKGLKPETVKLTMGEVKMSNYFLNKKIIDSDASGIKEFLQKSISKNSNVLLLIHGMWGNIIFAWNDMLNRLEPSLKEIRDQTDTIILSLIWDCTPLYKTNVEIAIWKGTVFSSVLTFLKGRELNRIDVLSHSMGNRVFQHMLVNLDKPEKLEINRWVMMAADLEPEVFEQSLMEYREKINNIFVFIHKQDRTLQISEFLNKKGRIGIDGPTRITENMKIIDVSHIKDNEDVATNYINHRYFYMSPTIRKEIYSILSNK